MGSPTFLHTCNHSCDCHIPTPSEALQVQHHIPSTCTTPHVSGTRHLVKHHLLELCANFSRCCTVRWCSKTERSHTGVLLVHQVLKLCAKLPRCLMFLISDVKQQGHPGGVVLCSFDCSTSAPESLATLPEKNVVKQRGHTARVILCSNRMELPEDPGAAWRIHRLQQGPPCDKSTFYIPLFPTYNHCLYETLQRQYRIYT
jgi:hypothetical protein